MARLDTSGYYALGVPMYLILAAADVYIAHRRGGRTYRFGDTLSNLSAGLGEVVIGLFLGPLLIALYDWAFAHFALIHWRENSPESWIVAFLLADLGYYVYHRAGHSVAVLFAVHGVHHQSEQFNLTLAMRHPWFSDFYSAPFYAALPLLGIPPLQFFVAISLISFYALTVHTMSFRRPGAFLLVTPQTHIVHHCRNPRYIGRNLGAMFTLWDRLFGTHVEIIPQDPPDLGTPTGYRTHSGARAQWIFFRDLIETARRATTLKDRLRVFFGRPGWRPPGVTVAREPPARADAVIPRATKLHAAGQFTATSLLSIYILWLRDRHSLPVQIVAAALILWSLGTIGALLDGLAGAEAGERRRLIVSAIVAAGAAIWMPQYRMAGMVLAGVWAVGIALWR